MVFENFYSGGRLIGSISQCMVSSQDRLFYQMKFLNSGRSNCSEVVFELKRISCLAMQWYWGGSGSVFSSSGYDRDRAQSNQRYVGSHTSCGFRPARSTRLNLWCPRSGSAKLMAYQYMPGSLSDKLISSTAILNSPLPWAWPGKLREMYENLVLWDIRQYA